MHLEYCNSKLDKLVPMVIVSDTMHVIYRVTFPFVQPSVLMVRNILRVTCYYTYVRTYM